METQGTGIGIELVNVGIETNFEEETVNLNT